MQEQNYSIKQWAKDERPREKLLALGAEKLSNSELLAILIHNGTQGRTAVDLAREVLLLGKNNLQELGKLTARELMKIRGIGEAKAMNIAAAMELGRRWLVSLPDEKIPVTCSEDIARFLQPKLRDQRREVFAVIYLNRANRILQYEVISEGGITATIVDPRIVMRRALEENAIKIILCHNHPSGNLRPSRQDEQLTQKLKEAARLFDIDVLDHLIVGETGYFSFADEGIL
jgi:DNA repair protein RadC